MFLVAKNSCVKGVYQISCFPCLKKEAEPAYETSCFIKKLDGGERPKNIE
jgi:hypothetical protein